MYGRPHDFSMAASARRIGRLGIQAAKCRVILILFSIAYKMPISPIVADEDDWASILMPRFSGARVSADIFSLLLFSILPPGMPPARGAIIKFRFISTVIFASGWAWRCAGWPTISAHGARPLGIAGFGVGAPPPRCVHADAGLKRRIRRRAPTSGAKLFAGLIASMPCRHAISAWFISHIDAMPPRHGTRRRSGGDIISHRRRHCPTSGTIVLGDRRSSRLHFRALPRQMPYRKLS